MKQYKIRVAYDGTGYAGWVQQKDQPTVVQTLQDTFFAVFKKKIAVLGASKTDAGVHAMGQVAVFTTDLDVDAAKIQWAWNRSLPPALLIRSLLQDDTFHPHYNVDEKTYYYHLFFSRPLPFYARYGAYISSAVDIKKFEVALRFFQGTHDFTAFYTGNDRSDTQRTINDIQLIFLKRYNAYRVIITGQKFMRHMIRRIIGAALAVACEGVVDESAIKQALQSGNSNHALPTAAAQGLMLYSITYKDPI